MGGDAVTGKMGDGGSSSRSTVRQLDRLFSRGSLAGQPDAQLLHRFATRNDEAAFEVLIGRHGPMVLGVCRRWLGEDIASVDDAFQATFLVLVRKARFLRDADRLGPWLHGVALRVARRARKMNLRRDERQRFPIELSEIHDRDVESAMQTLDCIDTSSILDEELSRLPEKHRVPLVLCYLQGLTHEQAADQLRWPVGTVRSRMAAARQRLRHRLVRRGVTAPAAMAIATLCADAAHAVHLSPNLIDQTLRIAMYAAPDATNSIVSTAIASLSQGVIHTMNMKKVLVALGLVAACFTTAGVGIAGSALVAQGRGSGAPAGAGRKVKGDDIAELRAQLEDARQRNASLEQQLQALQKQMEETRVFLSRGLLAGANEEQKTGVAFDELNAARKELWFAETERKKASIEFDMIDPNHPGAKDTKDVQDRVAFYDSYVKYLSSELERLESRAAKRSAELAMEKERAAKADTEAGMAPGTELLGGRGDLGMPGSGMPGGRMSGMSGRGLGGMPGGTMGGMGGAPGMSGLGGGGMTAGMMGGSGLGSMIGGGGGYGQVVGGIDRADLGIQMGETITAVQPKGDQRVLAHSTKTGVWRPYRLPEGVKATPVVSGNLLALGFQGESIPQIAIFTSADGTWWKHSLREPASGAISPEVGQTMAFYVIGNRVYAFSASAGRWDELELVESAQPRMMSSRIFVENDGKLCIFSESTGRWSIFDTKSDTAEDDAK